MVGIISDVCAPMLGDLLHIPQTGMRCDLSKRRPLSVCHQTWSSAWVLWFAPIKSWKCPDVYGFRINPSSEWRQISLWIFIVLPTIRGRNVSKFCFRACTAHEAFCQRAYLCMQRKIVHNLMVGSHAKVARHGSCADNQNWFVADQQRMTAARPFHVFLDEFNRFCATRILWLEVTVDTFCVHLAQSLKLLENVLLAW